MATEKKHMERSHRSHYKARYAERMAKKAKEAENIELMQSQFKKLAEAIKYLLFKNMFR